MKSNKERRIRGNMQVTMLEYKETDEIKHCIEKAKELMQEIIDKTIEDGKKEGKYAPGFEYPANQAAFAQMELNKILKIIEG
jgi:elongation factor P--beta-lysine ligase